MSTVNVLKFGEDVKIPINRENLRETLDAFQKDADVAQLKKMADHLKIKAVPFDKKLLLPVLIGEVQTEWYKTVQGQVPGQPEKNQKDRLTRYLANLEIIEKSDGTDLLVHRTSRSAGASSEPRKANVYRLVEKAKDGDKGWGKFKGQKFLIVKAMKSLDAGPGGKGCTVKQISDTVRDTDETKAPNEKNCAFHVNAFGHEGIVEKQGEDGNFGPAHAEPKPAKTEPAKAEPPKASVTPPPKDAAGKGKKKK